MPNIRLKAATQGGLAFDVSARSASSSLSGTGISLEAEPQDSEIFLAADPVITEVIYRASARALQHEIFMTYEAIPVINLPAETIVTSDSIGPFIIGFNPSDTPVVTDLPAFTIGFNSLADTASITDLPAFEVGRPLVDGVGTTDSVGPFTVGLNPSDSINTADSIGPFTIGFNSLTDAASITDLPAFTIGLNSLADSFSMTDSIGPFTIGFNPSDTANMSDVFEPTMTFSRTFADTPVVNEADAKTTTKVLPLDKEDEVTVTYTQAYSSGGAQIIFNSNAVLPGRDQNCAWAADIQLKSSYSSAECIWDVGGAFHGSYLGITSTGKLRFRGGEGRSTFQTTSTNGFVVEIDIADYPQFFDNQTHTLAWDISMTDKRGRLWIDNQLVMEESCSGNLGAGGAGVWAGGNDSGFGVGKGSSVAGNPDNINQTLNPYTGTITGNLRFYQNQLYTDVIGDFATPSDAAPIHTIGKNPSDSVSASDVPAFTAVTGFTDSISLGDAFSPQVAYSRLFTDTVTLSDASPTFIATKPIDTNTSTAQVDPDPVVMTDAPAMVFTRSPFTDSVSVSQNIVLQPIKSVVDSISASDNTYEIGASFEGDGGLFNSATLISSSPPFNEEFVLQTFSN